MINQVNTFERNFYEFSIYYLKLMFFLFRMVWDQKGYDVIYSFLNLGFK